MLPIVILLLLAGVQVAPQELDKVAVSHTCRTLRMLSAGANLHEAEFAKPRLAKPKGASKKKYDEFSTCLRPKIGGKGFKEKNQRSQPRAKSSESSQAFQVQTVHDIVHSTLSLFLVGAIVPPW